MATFTKVCLYCRQEFEATHALANICSSDCRNRTSGSVPGQEPRPSRPEKIPVEPARPRVVPEVGVGEAALAPVNREILGTAARCLRCGVAIEDATGSRKHCSSTCRRAMHRKKRKARLRRAYVEKVSIAVLSRRDEGKCRICGEPVDFTQQQPHPFAATIDHVIALVRAGEHSYGNTQLAHFGCNMQKGAG